MKTRVELDEQVVEFVGSLAPEPRQKVRATLHKLEKGGGDLKNLEGALSGYWRLREGSYRIIVRFYMHQGNPVARCIFAEKRAVVYELFAQLLAGGDT